MNLLLSQINELLVTLMLGRLCPCGHPGDGRGLGLSGMGLQEFSLPSSLSSPTPHTAGQESLAPHRHCRDFMLLAQNQGAGAACEALWDGCRQPGMRWSQRDPSSCAGSFSISSWGAVLPAPRSAEPEPGVTRAVCFPACYSLAPFSSQKSFASSNKKG